MSSWATPTKDVPRKQIRRSVVRGLRAAVHVLILGDPKFGGPTRDHLADEEIGAAVRDMVERLSTDELVKSPTLFQSLVERTSLP